MPLDAPLTQPTIGSTSWGSQINANFAAIESGFTSSKALPPGSVIQFAGSVVPSGWLMCNGSAVSRATYAALFASVGTSYGAGDGSTTFNLPDFRGRSIVGAGTGVGNGVAGSGSPNGASLTARTAGQFGGKETHSLTSTEMPAHTHAVPNTVDSGGTLEFSTVSDGPLGRVNGTSASAGSGSAHNIMQPFIVINLIIKT